MLWLGPAPPARSWREGQPFHEWRRLINWHSHFEEFTAAIRLERNMKHWPRAWNVRLIRDMNPDLRDLYEELNW